jgi:hypothetical protein
MISPHAWKLETTLKINGTGFSFINYIPIYTSHAQDINPSSTPRDDGHEVLAQGQHTKTLEHAASDGTIQH